MGKNEQSKDLEPLFQTTLLKRGKIAESCEVKHKAFGLFPHNRKDTNPATQALHT